MLCHFWAPELSFAFPPANLAFLLFQVSEGKFLSMEGSLEYVPDYLRVVFLSVHFPLRKKARLLQSIFCQGYSECFWAPCTHLPKVLSTSFWTHPKPLTKNNSKTKGFLFRFFGTKRLPFFGSVRLFFRKIFNVTKGSPFNFFGFFSKNGC